MGRVFPGVLEWPVLMAKNHFQSPNRKAPGEISCLSRTSALCARCKERKLLYSVSWALKTHLKIDIQSKKDSVSLKRDQQVVMLSPVYLNGWISHPGSVYRNFLPLPKVSSKSIAIWTQELLRLYYNSKRKTFHLSWRAQACLPILSISVNGTYSGKNNKCSECSLDGEHGNKHKICGETRLVSVYKAFSK